MILFIKKSVKSNDVVICVNIVPIVIISSRQRLVAIDGIVIDFLGIDCFVVASDAR